MQWFKNCRTMTKLMLGFGLTGVIMAGVGYMGVTNMAQINANVGNLYEVQLIPISYLTGIRGLTHQVRAQVILAVLATDDATTRQAVNRIEEMVKKIKELEEQFQPTILAETVREAFAAYRQAVQAYRQLRTEKVLQPALEGRKEEAYRTMMNEGAPVYQAVIDSINNVIAVKEGIAKTKFEESQNLYTTSRNVMLGLIITAVLLGLSLGYIIARMVAAALKQVMAVTEQAASGDLTVRVQLASKDELGQMGVALNGFLELRDADPLPVQARGQQGGFVGQVRQIRPREPGGLTSDGFQIHRFRQAQVARMHLEDRFPPNDVREADDDLPVEPPGPKERGVQHIGAVGGRHEDDPLLRVEPVHLHEEGIERLLPLIMAAADAREPLAPHRVNLVNEDDRPTPSLAHVATGLFEEITHSTVVQQDRLLTAKKRLLAAAAQVIHIPAIRPSGHREDLGAFPLPRDAGGWSKRMAGFPNDDIPILPSRQRRALDHPTPLLRPMPDANTDPVHGAQPCHLPNELLGD